MCTHPSTPKSVWQMAVQLSPHTALTKAQQQLLVGQDSGVCSKSGVDSKTFTSGQEENTTGNHSRPALDRDTKQGRADLGKPPLWSLSMDPY